MYILYLDSRHIVGVLTSTTPHPQLWHDTDECLIITQRYLSHKHKPQTRANEDRISVLLIWRRKNMIPPFWLVSWATILASDWSCHHPDQAGSASPNTRVWVSLYYGGDTISGSMGCDSASVASLHRSSRHYIVKLAIDYDRIIVEWTSHVGEIWNVLLLMPTFT